MTTATPTLDTPAPETMTCKHHWVISEPNGPTSTGRCKRCGREREFFNDPDEALLQPFKDAAQSSAARGQGATK